MNGETLDREAVTQRPITITDPVAGDEITQAMGPEVNSTTLLHENGVSTIEVRSVSKWT